MRWFSFNNIIANSLSTIAAYYFFARRPAIDVNFVNDGQVSIFYFISNSRYLMELRI